MAARRRNGGAVRRDDGSRVKATHHLGGEADRRLGVAAAMTGKTRSEIVEELVLVHLRRFVVHDREKHGAGQGAENVEGHSQPG